MLDAGKLIVIEGLDGAGTTTQVRLLEQWLIKEKGIQLYTTREPSEGPIGALIRAVLTKRMSADPLTISGLFAADRNDHIYRENGLLDQLRAGTWVLMDRYYLSSFAYQASGMDAKQMDWLKAIHRYCPPPDLTLFVDVPVKICLERIVRNRNAEFELFDEEAMLNRVYQEYLKAMKYFESQAERFVMVDGTMAIQAVHKQLRQEITAFFGLV